MIRVLIADDDPLVRMGLTMLFEDVPDVVVVGEAADGGEAVDGVRAHRPDLVLMDIRMPTVDGLAATEAINREASPPAVVVLTTFEADEHVLRALRCGAAGFLLKDTPPGDLVDAVRVVAAGDALLSPRVTKRLVERIARGDALGEDDRGRRARQALDSLTDRERAVAMAVAEGRSNAEIAAALHMGVPTVKAHVSRAMAKLGLANRVQVALVVHDAGTS